VPRRIPDFLSLEGELHSALVRFAAQWRSANRTSRARAARQAIAADLDRLVRDLDLTVPEPNDVSPKEAFDPLRGVLVRLAALGTMSHHEEDGPGRYCRFHQAFDLPVAVVSSHASGYAVAVAASLASTTGCLSMVATKPLGAVRLRRIVVVTRTAVPSRVSQDARGEYEHRKSRQESAWSRWSVEGREFLNLLSFSIRRVTCGRRVCKLLISGALTNARSRNLGDRGRLSDFRCRSVARARLNGALVVIGQHDSLSGGLHEWGVCAASGYRSIGGDQRTSRLRSGERAGRVPMCCGGYSDPFDDTTLSAHAHDSRVPDPIGQAQDDRKVHRTRADDRHDHDEQDEDRH
jgi:hypothetical protein